jgi:hypothetical protein
VHASAENLRRKAWLWRAMGVATAYFALWACAPMASLPPITTMDGTHRNDLGFAGSYERASRPIRVYDSQTQSGTSGQAWYQHRAGVFDLGVMAHGGQLPAGVGAGGFVRWRFLDQPNLRGGVQFDGGLLWSTIALPFAWQVQPDFWLYVAPAISLATVPYRLPIGASVRIGPGLFAHLEGMVSGGNPDCLTSSTNTCDGGAFDGPAVFTGTFGLSILP